MTSQTQTLSQWLLRPSPQCLSIWAPSCIDSCMSRWLEVAEEGMGPLDHQVYLVLFLKDTFHIHCALGLGRVAGSPTVSVTTYLLQGPPITENKSQSIERIERIKSSSSLHACRSHTIESVCFFFFCKYHARVYGTERCARLNTILLFEVVLASQRS